MEENIKDGDITLHQPPPLKKQATHVNSVNCVDVTPYDFSPLRRLATSATATMVAAGESVDVMVTYLQQVNRWTVADLISEELTGCPTNQVSVPVYKMYGVTMDGTSVCVNVYGFFPFIHIKCDPEVDDFMASEIVEVLEKRLEDTDHIYVPRISSRNRMKHILKWELERGFCCDQYHKDSSQVLKLTVALPQYTTLLGKLFYNSLLKSRGIKHDQDNVFDVETPSYGFIKVTPFTCFDAISQFQMEMELTGMGWVRFTDYRAVDKENYSDRGTSDIEVLVSYEHIRALPDDHSIAPLRMLTFDIECGNTSGFPTSERDPIIAISIHLSNEKGEKLAEILLQHGSADELGSGIQHIRFSGQNQDVVEREMLRVWGDLVVKDFDPDFIVGHNSNAFDIPYIIDRAHVLGVSAADCLGRGKYRFIPNKELIKLRKNGDKVITKDSTIIGRASIDTMVMFKSDTTKRERSYGLGALSQKYLGSGKDDVGYKMITPLWKTSNATRRRLALYNMKDTQLTFGLFVKFSMLYDTVQSSRITRVMPHTLLKSGQQVKVWAQLLYESKRPRWEPETTLRALLPFEIPREISREDKFKGATVFEPDRGWYDEEAVGVGDFASLYPSIIVSRNICYSTLVRPGKDKASLDLETMTETSPTGSTFVIKNVRESLLAKMCIKLLDARKEAKKELETAKNPTEKTIANSKQLAIKISTNSIYGFMGASGGKLVRVEMAASVTGWGREMVDLAKTCAQEPQFGGVVIYGDTDSIMIRMPHLKSDLPAVFKNLVAICEYVTKKFGRYPVMLQPEKVYYPYLLLDKKRYVGMMYMSPTICKGVDMKGVETARRDSCSYVTETLSIMLDKVMKMTPKPQVLSYIISRLTLLLKHEVELHQLVVSRSLNKTEYKNQQPHACLAKKMTQRVDGYVAAVGERIPYIFTHQAGKRSVANQAEDPLYAIEHNIPIDYEFYIEHQLKKPIIRMMAWIFGEGNVKKTEAIIFGNDELRRVPRKSNAVSHMGLGRYFVVVPKCLSCGVLVSEQQQQQPNVLHSEKISVTETTTTTTSSSSKSFTGFCAQCKANGGAAEAHKKMKMDVEELDKIYLGYRAKCAECRGYDDETACVQVDCAVTFQKAACVKKLKETKQKLETSSF